jgi:hypothetical protein
MKEVKLLTQEGEYHMMDSEFCLGRVKKTR